VNNLKMPFNSLNGKI